MALPMSACGETRCGDTRQRHLYFSKPEGTPHAYFGLLPFSQEGMGMLDQFRERLGAFKDRDQQIRELRQILHEHPELREQYPELAEVKKPTHRGSDAGKQRTLHQSGYSGDGRNMKSAGKGSGATDAGWRAWVGDPRYKTIDGHIELVNCRFNQVQAGKYGTNTPGDEEWQQANRDFRQRCRATSDHMSPVEVIGG
jgi:hypothetical protein